jgi:hypothetical protein
MQQADGGFFKDADEPPSSPNPFSGEGESDFLLPSPQGEGLGVRAFRGLKRKFSELFRNGFTLGRSVRFYRFLLEDGIERNRWVLV